jgi:hypothetical protein
LLFLTSWPPSLLRRAFSNVRIATGVNMKIRYLKVRDTYYEHHLKQWPRPPADPIIQLKGYWLNQIGFEIGKQILVLPGIDHLVITSASDKIL